MSEKKPYKTTFNNFVNAIQRDSLFAIDTLRRVLKHYTELTTKENRKLEIEFENS